MLNNFRLLLGTVVTTKNSLIKDTPVGKAIDTVIDSESGKIEALWVSTNQGMRLLMVKDILSWKQIEIQVSDENDLVKAEELPKLQKILNKEVPILGASVYIESTHKRLGRVINFAFDTISPKILSLQVRSGWWVFGSNRTIPRTKITKMTEKAIFINDQGIKITDKSNIPKTETKAPEPQ
mgnify:CR=1 FL=1